MTDERSGRGLETNRASNPWLWAAGAATLVALILGVSMAGGLASTLSPNEMFETPVSDATDAEPLVVVVARTPGGAGEWSTFASVIAHVSEEMGTPMTVRYVPREDEAGAVVMAEEADVAFLCSHMYLDLREADVIEGLAVPVIDGMSESTMQLVVRAEDAGTTFDDLAGRPVAISDKSSLGGQAFMYWLCGEKGVVFPDYFSDVYSGETMEENVSALLAGEVDATVVNSVQLSPGRSELLAVVEESPAFGMPPMVVSTSMNEVTKQQLLDAILAFDPETDIDGETRLDGFVPIDDVDYSFEEVLRTQCGDHGHI